MDIAVDWDTKIKIWNLESFSLIDSNVHYFWEKILRDNDEKKDDDDDKI